MSYIWDVLLRVAAMGCGIAMYAWLLSYDPGDRSRGPSGDRE